MWFQDFSASGLRTNQNKPTNRFLFFSLEKKRKEKEIFLHLYSPFLTPNARLQMQFLCVRGDEINNRQPDLCGCSFCFTTRKRLDSRERFTASSECTFRLVVTPPWNHCFPSCINIQHSSQFDPKSLGKKPQRALSKFGKEPFYFFSWTNSSCFFFWT